MIATAAAILVEQESGRNFLARYLHLFLIGMTIAHITRNTTQRIERFTDIAMAVCIALFVYVFITVPDRYPSDFVYGDPLAVIACAG